MGFRDGKRYKQVWLEELVTMRRVSIILAALAVMLAGCGSNKFAAQEPTTTSSTVPGSLPPEEQHTADERPEDLVGVIDNYQNMLASQEPREKVYEAISSPQNSDLDSATFNWVTSTARSFLQSDLTGRGRERFPGYWSNSDARGSEPLLQSVVILAVGAAANFVPNRVSAFLVWQGQGLGIASTEVQTTEVFFQVEGSSLRPLHQWEP